MKSRPALFALVALPMFVAAQPVIDEGFTPQVGDVFTYTTGTYTPITTAGEDAFWDLSSLSPGAQSSLTAVDPVATGYSDLYPTAMVALDGGAVIQYMRADASGIYIVGVYRDFGTQVIQIQYGEESLFLPYPCTYNTAFTDSFTYGYTYTGGTVNGGGNRAYTADGFGTLVLPYDTIYNVLKLTGIDTTYESVPGQAYVTVSQQVYFYKPGLHYFLLSATDISQTLNGGPPQTANSLYYLSEGMFTEVGVPAKQAIGVEVWPVPARDQLNISYGLAGGHQVDLALYDATGRPVRSVQTRTAAAGIQAALLDVKGLPAGIYLLKVTDDHGQSGSRKVVVE